MQPLLPSSRQLWRSNAGTIAEVGPGLAAHLGVNTTAKRSLMMNQELLNGRRLPAYFNRFIHLQDWWKFSTVALE